MVTSLFTRAQHSQSLDIYTIIIYIIYINIWAGTSHTSQGSTHTALLPAQILNRYNILSQTNK